MMPLDVWKGIVAILVRTTSPNSGSPFATAMVFGVMERSVKMLPSFRLSMSCKKDQTSALGLVPPLSPGPHRKVHSDSDLCGVISKTLKIQGTGYMKHGTSLCITVLEGALSPLA
jgi:hypothetical protein